MLWGNWGSFSFQSGPEARRAALRSRAAPSFHEPPRATRGSRSVGSLRGQWRSAPESAACASGVRRSGPHRAPVPLALMGDGVLAETRARTSAQVHG